ncbi:YbaB/EbfC family nucleoid-associated protein [Nocardioides sp. SOB77]|uniref:YbaB/EbfC family nucleoid-associated protein n=1 Tax=Nocardioides oceani TaxID=3058369 RepID=A0ABT8FL42_9ACTN|nr:YbaB/EbfC family nucleoid-associated protein [Nocardioides oceani]MDN4175402.1 YbaB/EbfC family nucleoid-associated protein [Nocardioides oceani]
MTTQPGSATEVTPETLAEIRAGAERRAAEAREASDRIRTIRAEGRSDRGLVTVWVDGSALVEDVRFSDGASSSPGILGTMLKQAHDRAVADWQRQVVAITDAVLEDQPMLREHIQRVSAEDARAHTLPPDEEDPAAPEHGGADRR